MQKIKEIVESFATLGTDGLAHWNRYEIVPMAQECAKQQAIDFGRWLLANADIVLDSNDAWSWNTDKNVTTEEAFEQYLKENES